MMAETRFSHHNPYLHYHRPVNHFQNLPGNWLMVPPNLSRRTWSALYRIAPALEEALGRVPTLKEFGANKLDYYGKSISENPAEAWKVYSQAIETAKNVSTETLR